MLGYTARMVATCLCAWGEGPVDALGTVRTAHRAWPGDCDPNFHVNEGAYLKIAGLARLALWVRMGLTRAIVVGGLRPAAVSSAVTFHREIRPFARFCVASRLMTWDGRYLYFEHRFEREGHDSARMDAARVDAARVDAARVDAARVIVRSVFRDGSGPVDAARVLAGLGHAGPAPALPPELEHWARMREAGRGSPT